ncbi:DUF2017 family protein [Gaiella sp.]|uniref:DUF2017 family protein n=1 Tax=Gaiella sp. TaxID=2663207 RepID=UPI003265143D
MPSRRIQPDRKGGYYLRLPPEEREILHSLPGQMRAVMETDDPSLRRLFPPAYPDDSEADDEFRRLMREEILDGKLKALRIVEETADADHLTDEQLEGWLGALESLRLYLGTQLDISEATYESDLDPDNPDAPALALYGYLSWLQEEAVAALSANLP